MTKEKGPFPLTLGQTLWIAAGALIITFLVVAASWLFSPRPAGEGAPTNPGVVREETVTRDSFQPEKAGEEEAGGRRAVPAGPGSESRAKSRPSRAPEAERPTSPPSASPEPSSPGPGLPPEPGRHAEPASLGPYGVQAGAFAAPENARQLARRLSALGYHAEVIVSENKNRVVVTGFPTRAEAEKVRDELAARGIGGAFIVPARKP